jgi:hypothetical protein
LVFVFLVFVFLGTDFIFTQNKIHEVKLSGNAYVTSFPAGAAVTANGLEKWTDNRSVIQTYIYFSQPQTVKLSIKGSTDGRSTYLVSFQNKKIKVRIVFMLVPWRKYKIYVAIGSACPIQIQLRE